MMITPEKALAAASEFLEGRPGVHVSVLWEDESDYFAQQELDPGHVWRLGESQVFVSKETGRVWTSSPGEGIMRAEKMRLVPGAPEARSQSDR